MAGLCITRELKNYTVTKNKQCEIVSWLGLQNSVPLETRMKWNKEFTIEPYDIMLYVCKDGYVLDIYDVKGYRYNITRDRDIRTIIIGCLDTILSKDSFLHQYNWKGV